jgi:ribonuclease E
VPETAEPEAESAPQADAPSAMDLVLAAELGEPGDPEPEASTAPRTPRRRRLRGRRHTGAEPGEETVNAVPPETVVYADIADIFEAAERAEEAQRAEEAGRAEAHIVAEVEHELAPEAVLETVSAEPEAASAPEPEVEVASAPAPVPLVRPVIIGASEAPVEKKSGWWRR